MHVLVIEPHLEGHRGEYAYRIISSGVRLGHTIYFCTMPKSVEHPAWQHISDVLPIECRLIFERNSASNFSEKYLGSQYGYYCWFKRATADALRKISADLVVVPYSDYILPLTGILGSPFSGKPWSGITMRYSTHFRELGILKSRHSVIRDAFRNMALSRALSNDSLKILFTIDPTITDYFKVPGRTSRKLKYLADPADFTVQGSKLDARRRLGLPHDQFVILVYGGIGPRKGIDALLRSLDDIDKSHRVGLLIVGEWSYSHLDQIASRYPDLKVRISQRVHVIDGYADKEKEALVFTAADAVWLGYRDHDYMSGVLVLAGQARKPVVADIHGVIGYLVGAHKLGELVSILNIQSISAALSRLMTNESLCKMYGDNGLTRFVDDTSLKFAETFWSEMELALNCLSIGPPPIYSSEG